MEQDAALWRDRAIAERARQNLQGAREASAAALALSPGDGMTAFLDAQIAYELGLPAAHLFAAARALLPENRNVLRNEALALASEGAGEAAQALLEDALGAAPDWLDGHRVLASLRWTAGDSEDFDAGLARALAALPEHGGLWLGWFGALAQVREWPRAIRVLDAAERRIGRSRAIVTARAFAATESGNLGTAHALFAELGETGDAFAVLARIRLSLRAGAPEEVEALALPLTRGPAAGQAWPYLAAAWRLLGDPRAAWLDGDPAFAWEVDAGFTGAELAALSRVLRGLHRAKGAYPNQSVRGGTQTDLSLLLRHEPELVQARARLMAAVAETVAALPCAVEGHPLLGRARSDLRIAGSWSVLLGPGGRNVVHSHPQGWLSAVFYADVPPAAVMGAAPAGYLQLGAPPAELGTGLAPTLLIAPLAGKLAIFPSTTWHGTEPTHGGERLNIAFDVVPASG